MATTFLSKLQHVSEANLSCEFGVVPKCPLQLIAMCFQRRPEEFACSFVPRDKHAEELIVAG
jgi:hypothetical protein